MQPSQQKNLPEDLETVLLKSFKVDERTAELIQGDDISTPYILVKEVENFLENTFWVNLQNLWVLIGKVPPLSVEMDDIIIFREKGRWGLFRFVERGKDFVVLTDGLRRKKTKVKVEDFSQLNFLGKVIRVQKRV